MDLNRQYQVTQTLAACPLLRPNSGMNFLQLIELCTCYCLDAPALIPSGSTYRPDNRLAPAVQLFVREGDR